MWQNWSVDLGVNFEICAIGANLAFVAFQRRIPKTKQNVFLVSQIDKCICML
jgi:hypothetical protein